MELTVENHNYDVVWMNPATGELIKQKDYKGEHFTGEPPDKSHDWVLRVSREGRKEGMLKSYKFDSRPVPVQEVEQNPAKIPFEITAPPGAEISPRPPVRSQDSGHPGNPVADGRVDRGGTQEGDGYRAVEPQRRNAGPPAPRAAATRQSELAANAAQRQWEGLYAG